MSSPGSIDKKVVRFVGPSVRDDFRNLPPQVHSAATDVLLTLQRGEFPKGRDVYDRLKGDLAGIDEIRIDGPDGNTYRVYDIIRFPRSSTFSTRGPRNRPRAARSRRPTREG